MPLLIGTDEAGYGPNLGPLVITATTWQLPDEIQPDELWTHLSSSLTRKPRRGDERLHVADSKQVYSAGGSLAPLELSVLAFLRVLNYPSHSLTSLGTALAGSDFADDYAAVRQNVVSELSLPVHNPVDACERAASQLSGALAIAGVRMESVHSRIMFAEEFNRRVASAGSKGKVLSAATLQLVRQAVDAAPAEAAGWVVCDKHGGRNRYDEIIAEAFDDAFVFRIEESGPSSRYRVGSLDFCFRTKAEELLPVAVASMVSKYVRELVMISFNRFWQHHLPELKATKGYPVDAKRFWADISGKADELGIARTEIWRSR